MKRAEFIEKLCHRFFYYEAQCLKKSNALEHLRTIQKQIDACQTIGELVGLACTEGFEAGGVMEWILEIVIEDPVDNEYDGIPT